MAKHQAVSQSLADKTAAESARILLPKLVRDFFRTGRSLLSNAPSNDDLHRVRLKAKQLRYSMELFGACYGSGLDQRIEALKNLQDHLGAISDCEAVAALIDPALQKAEGGSEFLEFLEARAANEREAFLRRWHQTFDAAGQEKWWVDYLSRAATGIVDGVPELVKSPSSEITPASPLKIAIR